MERVWRWFEPPTIEATLYRCLECNVELDSDDTFCPECGSEVEEVSEPVAYSQWEFYY